ncbi:hypothetical protein [Aristophania vespae]|uniref:hypothetical protein n=1 Tax=Aristophania vespae TaxID=2697033 RepID=UPI0023514C6E|nr:hypothetical protein [Aristophania vespae]UMM63163.1 hypothetical protein DM15PD_01180 [Aristophania vespae]
MKQTKRRQNSYARQNIITTNFPTRERMNKADYEQAGKRRRRSNTLEALRSKVGDDVIADAKLWIEKWELAENGYCDAHKNATSPAIAGDAFTFNALRGRTLRQLNDFKRHAGPKSHFLLIQLLGYGWSFSSIGRERWPELSQSRQRHKASELCADTLSTLHNFWMKQRKIKTCQKVEAAKLYNEGYTLPALCQHYNMAAPNVRKLIEEGKKIISRPKHRLTIIAE